MRLVAPAAVVAAAVLALGGCSSEEPLPVGPDGSGSFRTAERATATLVDPDGAVVARAEAEADVSDLLDLRLQATGLEPGTYRVRLSPGRTCEDGAGGRSGPALPDLAVDRAGAASYDETAGLSLDELDGGAALRLVGPTRACGVLADH